MTARVDDDRHGGGAGRRSVHVSHSQFVRLAKIVLPATALALLVLVLLWPTFQAQVEQAVLDAPAPRPDARSQITNPRFSGVDQSGQPFTVTGEVAFQSVDDAHTIIVEQPHARMAMDSDLGTQAVAERAVYDEQGQTVDLSGSVVLSRDDGYRFTSPSLAIDLAAERAWGEEPVAVSGPGLALSAQGVEVANGGDWVYFAGPARLILDQAAARATPQAEDAP